MVTFDNRDPRFKSQHREKCICQLHNIERTKKRKRGQDRPIKKIVLNKYECIILKNVPVALNKFFNVVIGTFQTKTG